MRSSAVDGRLGACHRVEPPFVFARLDLPALRGAKGLLGPDPLPAEPARRTHATWVAFVHRGEPGWSPSQVEVLGTEPHLEPLKL